MTIQSNLDVPLLREVQRRIKLQPLNFDMKWWTHTIFKNFQIHQCETTRCIGGWAYAIKTGCFVDRYIGEEECADALMLTMNDANRLFYVSQWPPEFAPQCFSKEGIYYRSSEDKVTAEQAVAYIDWFIPYQLNLQNKRRLSHHEILEVEMTQEEFAEV
jgi:hypothetical protein